MNIPGEADQSMEVNTFMEKTCHVCTAFVDSRMMLGCMRSPNKRVEAGVCTMYIAACVCARIGQAMNESRYTRLIRAISAGCRCLTKRSESKVRGRRSSRAELSGCSRLQLRV